MASELSIAELEAVNDNLRREIAYLRAQLVSGADASITASPTQDQNQPPPWVAAILKDQFCFCPSASAFKSHFRSKMDIGHELVASEECKQDKVKESDSVNDKTFAKDSDLGANHLIDRSERCVGRLLSAGFMASIMLKGVKCGSVSGS